LPRGEPGELCTAGYSVMLGYWDEPEKTADAIDRSRWMHTGDIGIMDDEGIPQHHRPIKDMVIRGGRTCTRARSEFLYSHPDIVDAQVIGVGRALREELCAWVTLRPARPPDRGGVREFATASSRTTRSPRYVLIAEEFR